MTILRSASFLTGDLCAVQQRCARDDGRAVLIVVEDGDRHARPQPCLDLEALRRLQILEVDATEGRLERGDDVDEAGRVARVDLQIEDVDVGELLEQAGLAFHDRLAGQRPDVAETENRRAVGDDRDQVAARGVLPGHLGIGGDLQARLGDARRVGERQIALRDQRLGRDHLQLSRPAVAVVVERVVLPNHCRKTLTGFRPLRSARSTFLPGRQSDRRERVPRRERGRHRHRNPQRVPRPPRWARASKSSLSPTRSRTRCRPKARSPGCSGPATGWGSPGTSGEHSPARRRC